MEPFSYREYIRFGTRIAFFSSLLCLGLIALILRLAYLQILSGDYYRALGDEHRVRTKRLEAYRGVICDANGVWLADNRTVFTLVAIPRDMKSKEQSLDTTIEKLSDLLNLDADEVRERLKSKGDYPWQPVVLKRDLTFDQLSAVAEHNLDLPGITTELKPTRRYPFGSLAAHLLGYTGEVNKTELEEKRKENPGAYHLGSYIGKAGAEKAAEEYLRGEDGMMIVEVNSLGAPQLDPQGTVRAYEKLTWFGLPYKELADTVEPKPGGNVRLTLDKNIQSAVEEALDQRQQELLAEDPEALLVGAVVVLEADTGAVRAMASRPTFDPNSFTSPSMSNKISAILNDPLRPLLSRGYQSAFAPGSTFKIIMATAGLESGVINADTRFTCNGSYTLPYPGGREFHCWKEQGHGSINVVDALTYSCDVFFYNLGMRLGVERISAWAQKFGLGAPTGLGLPSEKAGLVPSLEWKKAAFNRPDDKRWYPGETVNLSIGQGHLTTTPLQMAQVMAIVANGGHAIKVHILESVDTPDDQSSSLAPPPPQDRIIEKESTLQLVQEGLRQATTRRQPFQGTALQVQVPGLDLMGKTGTSQVASLAFTGEERKNIPRHLRDHAWFVTAVLNREPKLAIAVMLEHAGHGGAAAAPVAREILKRIYFPEGVPGADEGKDKETVLATLSDAAD